MKIYTILFKTILFTFFPVLLFAQPEVGVSFGLAGHQGDVHSISDANISVLNELNLAYGLFYQYRLNHRFGVRANLNYLKLSGSDSNFSDLGHLQRGYSFYNNILETSAVVQLEIIRKKRYKKYLFNNPLRPYLFGGVGFGYISPNVNFNSNLIDAFLASIEKDKTASRFQLIVPIGGGLRYDLNSYLGFALEASFRVPVSDYYDGISAMANPEKNDFYGIGFAKLIFNLGINYYDTENNYSNAKDESLSNLEESSDTDRDGIINSDDACPDQPGKEINQGCPDTDNDGIIDAYDACPYNTGIMELFGCPDSDLDGIIDMQDGCPYEKGEVENGGCPDADKDGIIDKYDSCPHEAGTVSEKGCPIKDWDKDGIPDKMDNCPREKGLVENNGCPILEEEPRSKKIIDLYASCDLYSNEVGRFGCPKRKISLENEEDILKEVTRKIRFEATSDELNSASKIALNRLVDLMQSTTKTLVIEGYTDSIGDEKENYILSQKRAIACYQYLMNKGVLGIQMTARGYGESNPIASNKTEKGRLQNRRVTFELK